MPAFASARTSSSVLQLVSSTTNFSGSACDTYPTTGSGVAYMASAAETYGSAGVGPMYPTTGAGAAHTAGRSQRNHFWSCVRHSWRWTSIHNTAGGGEGYIINKCWRGEHGLWAHATFTVAGNVHVAAGAWRSVGHWRVVHHLSFPFLFPPFSVSPRQQPNPIPPLFAPSRMFRTVPDASFRRKQPKDLNTSNNLKT